MNFADEVASVTAVCLTDDFRSSLHSPSDESPRLIAHSLAN